MEGVLSRKIDRFETVFVSPSGRFDLSGVRLCCFLSLKWENGLDCVCSSARASDLSLSSWTGLRFGSSVSVAA